MQLLLVEDNQADAFLLQEILHEAGLSCAVWVVEDGEQALAFLQRQGEYQDVPRPDCIVLDLNLPRLNGHEVLAKLQTMPQWQHIPVLVLTTSPAEADHQQAVQRGARAYFCKPYDLEGYQPVVHAVAQYQLENSAQTGQPRRPGAAWTYQ